GVAALAGGNAGAVRVRPVAVAGGAAGATAPPASAGQPRPGGGRDGVAGGRAFLERTARTPRKPRRKQRKWICLILLHSFHLGVLGVLAVRFICTPQVPLVD